MQSVLEILNNISARRSTAANPVISNAVAEMLGKMKSTRHFNPEEDTEIVLSPLPKRFTANAYSRMGWAIDTMIKNDLKSSTIALEKKGIKFDPTDRFEFFTNAELALQETYESEANSYESGFEASGTLHRIAALLNIRMAYHDCAQVHVLKGREYSVQSIEVQIGEPQKQSIKKEELANFRFQVLKQADKLSDIEFRNHLDHGIMWTNELTAKTSTLTNLSAAQKRKAGELPPSEYLSKVQPIEERIAELSANLANLPEDAVAAVTEYVKKVQERQKALDKFYQDDLNRIPVMTLIRDFCVTKVPDEKMTFNQLPTIVQVTLLDNIAASLDQTLNGMTTAPTHLFQQYDTAVTALKEFFNTAIHERLEGEDTGYSEPTLTQEEKEAANAQSVRRRRNHKKLEA